MLATERTNGAMRRLTSLRQKENIYSKCWALKSFVTHHPLLRIVINPAFCQTALLHAAQCQKKTSHASYLQLGLLCCAAWLLCVFLSHWFHLLSQDQALHYWSEPQSQVGDAIQQVPLDPSNSLAQANNFISWNMNFSKCGLLSTHCCHWVNISPYQHLSMTRQLQQCQPTESLTLPWCAKVYLETVTLRINYPPHT